MAPTIVITCLTCVMLILIVLIKPEIKIKKHKISIYPLVAVIGSLAIIIFTPLSLSDCIDGIASKNSINPIKIITLFISVTAISIFLDEAGFFEFLAIKVLALSGGKQRKMFVILYFIVSLLTIFTSNDIIILTFTPFIICFCKNAKIKALPYLITEFVAANTWSMTLIIGNPTNIYLATSNNIDFFSYLKIMFLPTLLCGICSFVTLFVLFRKDLNKTFEIEIQDAKLKDKQMCFLGGSVLLICTISLSISNLIEVEMWLECLICAFVLFLSAATILLLEHKKPTIVLKTISRLPYSIIPFVFSMFVISLGLEKVEVTNYIAKYLSYNEVLLYGTTSFLSSNLVNNIPMSVIYTSMINSSNASNYAVYSSIIGSNLGALLTPVGALAGIMFSSILNKYGEKFSPLSFLRYGIIVAPISLCVSLSTLYFVLSFM